MPAVWAFHEQKWPASLVSNAPALTWDMHLVVPSSSQVCGWTVVGSRCLSAVEADSVEGRTDVTPPLCCSFCRTVVHLYSCDRGIAQNL